MKYIFLTLLLILCHSSIAQTYFTNYRTIRDLTLKENTPKEYKLNKFSFEKDIVEWYVGYNLIPMQFTVLEIDNGAKDNIFTYKTIDPKGNIMYFLISKESVALLSEMSDQMYIYSILIKG